MMILKLHLLKTNLDKAGLYTSSFTDPVMALEEFKSHYINYDLVISDIRMPIMNGYELAQQVKKIKPAKVLLTSAYEHDYDKQNFGKGLLPSDIDGFIEKPISLNKSSTTVVDMLNHRFHVPI
jgi:CheY-like chemotaxis protein